MKPFCNKIVSCAAATVILFATMPVQGAEETVRNAAPVFVAQAASTEQEPTIPEAQQPKQKDVQKNSQQTEAQPAQKENILPVQTVGQPPERSAEVKKPQMAEIFDEPGVLTPRGTLTLEPSFQFINSASNRVALSGYTIIPSFTIGLIDVRNVNSNTYIATLGARYGITSRMEFEVRVPYVHRDDSTSYEPTTDPNTQQAIPASVFNADGTDIGDIEFGPRIQLNKPAGGAGPFFIAGLRVKSNTGKDPFEVSKSLTTTPAGNQLPTELPTGSGFWGFQPSITGIYSSDPAVFFGTISYMYNMDREIDGTKYDPGDTVGFNFGIGMGLNEKTSISIGYDHVILGKPKEDGDPVPGSIITQIGSLLIGCSYRMTDKTTLNFSLGAGVTSAASDIQLTLRLPTSFLLLD